MTTRKILMTTEVQEMLRLKSRSALRRMINSGEFPRGFPIGLRRLGWFEDEVIAWLENRAAKARGEVA